MTPLEVGVLLHYWVSPEDHPKLHIPIYSEFCERMVSEGVLERATTEGTKYTRSKAALKVYVDAILSVPLPVQQWVIPEP